MSNKVFELLKNCTNADGTANIDYVVKTIEDGIMEESDLVGYFQISFCETQLNELHGAVFRAFMRQAKDAVNSASDAEERQFAVEELRRIPGDLRKMFNSEDCIFTREVPKMSKDIYDKKHGIFVRV